MTAEEAYKFGMETFRKREDPFIGARFLVKWFKTYLDEFPTSPRNESLRERIAHVESDRDGILLSSDDLLRIFPMSGKPN